MIIPRNSQGQPRGKGRHDSAASRRRARPIVAIEALEGRQMLSTTGLLEQRNLVSDQPGIAEVLDPNLVNPWGISESPNGGAFWLSDNGTGISPLYLGDLGGSPINHLFDVTIPGAKPTGTVFNPFQSVMSNGTSNDFSVTDGTNSAPSVFLFASKTGAITGWAPSVGTPGGPFNISLFAKTGFQSTDGAIYTGLAIGNVGNAHYLYAADFHNGKIDVIDGQFQKVTLAGSFSDHNLPAGYAPFNVQNLGDKLYVTYAQQDAAKDGGSVAGQGKGYVDVFDMSGNLIQRVASRGQLNAPWGVAMAPAGFSSFGGDLLIGNFGDGHIDAYDPSHNYAFDGQLKGADGTAVTLPGLWALQFGNGVSSGDANTLFFTAGPGGGHHGLFGSLSAVSTVAVSQFTNADGSLGLKVVTTGQSDTVTITEDAMANTTTVVSDGRTQVFDHLFTKFNLQLHSKKDQLTFAEAGTEAIVGRRLSVLADLGTGENHLTFNSAQTDGEPADIFGHSDVSLSVMGHNGNDFVNLSFDDITESRVVVNVQGIGGSKMPLGPGVVRDSITFGHPGEIGGIRNSSVDVNVLLGQGNINLAFNDKVDLGHFDEDKAPGDPTAFGPSTMNVNIAGSGRRQDVDNVTLLASGVVNTASTLNFNTNLGAGNNSFKGMIDANTFRIANDAGGSAGGAAHFNVQAGRGDDAITFKSVNQTSAIELSGLLDVNILGGSGKDNIQVDLGGSGFTDGSTSARMAMNRAFRLRLAGGSGDETTMVNLANSPTATFNYDVALLGGSGANSITFIGTNPVGGAPTFGAAGSVFIDANGGKVNVFGNYPVRVVH
jgi:uncharacterized protein (TIGR03118 family)